MSQLRRCTTTLRALPGESCKLHLISGAALPRVRLGPRIALHCIPFAETSRLEVMYVRSKHALTCRSGP